MEVSQTLTPKQLQNRLNETVHPAMTTTAGYSLASPPRAEVSAASGLGVSVRQVDEPPTAHDGFQWYMAVAGWATGARRQDSRIDASVKEFPYTIFCTFCPTGFF